MDKYSEKVLARLWKAQRLSWWMTTLLHTFPESLAYDQRLQDGDLAVLFSLENALRVLAENYSAL
jgi:p-hydroxybenzoate 3-monooxygenase